MKASFPILPPGEPFPDPESASSDGLVAITSGLTTQRLLEAYRRGIFPWTEHPVTWWSPDPRGILPLDKFHVPRRLDRTIRAGKFRFTVNQAFESVVLSCAEATPKRKESWIGPAMIQAYTGLYRQGYAISFETWQGNQLVGGLYGVRMAGFFAGESMFYRVRDASSAALVFAARTLGHQGCELFDLQMVTDHTQRFGAIQIPRKEYLNRLARALA